MIIDHRHRCYQQIWQASEANKYNGAYYYSKEIVKNIIPNIKTSYNWVTIMVPQTACSHSIVFIHNNLYPERYDYLSNYSDLILVCGVKDTMQKVAHLGTPIYLPLSVDVAEVSQYRTEKSKEAAYVGRPEKRKFKDVLLPSDIDFLENLPREKLLAEMAKYKTIYAVGRTAIEAKVLGCEVKAYDPRFPDPMIWEVLDNRAAAKILQNKLDALQK